MMPTQMSLAEMVNLLVIWRNLGATAQSGSPLAFFNYCLGNLAGSRAQILQDLWVSYETGRKTGGYFVEIGAGDGMNLSNTYYLETQLGWTGLLAEAAKGFHGPLRANRRCTIDERCVWSATDEELVFNETPYRELSTIDSLSAADSHGASREAGSRYPVKTVTLNDLLAGAGAPSTIDYLSIDTEGSEFEILSAFDFSRFDVRLITVEHNFTANRQRIFDLLTAQGFERRLEAFSQFDDWYVRKS